MAAATILISNLWASIKSFAPNLVHGWQIYSARRVQDECAVICGYDAILYFKILL